MISKYCDLTTHDKIYWELLNLILPEVLLLVKTFKDPQYLL